MLNGSTLKVVFMAIVGTLCLILFVLTVAVLTKHFSVEDYKQTLEILGIPTFFGMIGQSFIHYNQNGGSNVPNNNKILPEPIQEPGVSKV